MPRPRTNDPLGVCDDPVVVLDPLRQIMLAEEFQRRLAYVRESYCLWAAHVGSNVEFNKSLGLLKRAVARRNRSGNLSRRLHPELEILLNVEARKRAELRTGRAGEELTCEDMSEAALHICATVETRRGARDYHVLRHHVEGLMALLQQTAGKPVLPRRARKKDAYDPHFPDPIGQKVAAFFRQIDPLINDTKLVNMVGDARRKFAGKRMRFADFFPAYSANLSETGDLTMANRQSIQFRENTPVWSR